MSGTRKKDRFVPRKIAGNEEESITQTLHVARGQARSQVRPHGKKRGMSLGTKVTGVVALAIVILAVIFFANNISGSANSANGSSSSGSSAYPYQVGSPGPGAQAPSIQLASTSGGTFTLGTQKSQNVLLFFMEGVGCEPCWTQIKDIETHWGQFSALGINKLVTITTNTIPQLDQKVADEKVHTPVLSDPSLSVSYEYNANKYGMMGDQMDGHTFVLVGKGGVIRWRADYGGAPKYTMYLPVPALIQDIRKGLHGHAA